MLSLLGFRNVVDMEHVAAVDFELAVGLGIVVLVSLRLARLARVKRTIFHM